jgi:toxin ParE1/3/4
MTAWPTIPIAVHRAPALGPNVRIGVVSPYIVIYRHAEDTVNVLRIVHGRRRITDKLLSG